MPNASGPLPLGMGLGGSVGRNNRDRRALGPLYAARASPLGGGRKRGQRGFLGK